MSDEFYLGTLDPDNDENLEVRPPGIIPSRPPLLGGNGLTLVTPIGFVQEEDEEDPDWIDEDDDADYDESMQDLQEAIRLAHGDEEDEEEDDDDDDEGNGHDDEEQRVVTIQLAESDDPEGSSASDNASALRSTWWPATDGLRPR
jgi:hypothetical protein